MAIVMKRKVELEMIMTGMDPTAMQSVRWVTRLEGMVTRRDWSSTSCRVGQRGNKVLAATTRLDRITRVSTMHRTTSKLPVSPSSPVSTVSHAVSQVGDQIEGDGDHERLV